MLHRARRCWGQRSCSRLPWRPGLQHAPRRASMRARLLRQAQRVRGGSSRRQKIQSSHLCGGTRRARSRRAAPLPLRRCRRQVRTAPPLMPARRAQRVRRAPSGHAGEAGAAHDGSVAAPLDGARNSSAALWLAGPRGVASALASNDALSRRRHCGLHLPDVPRCSCNFVHGGVFTGMGLRLVSASVLFVCWLGLCMPRA